MDTDTKECRCSLLKRTRNLISDYPQLVIGVGAIALGYKLRRFLKTRDLRRKWDSVGKDVVVLHAGGPSRTILHASPFATKVDLYLTMSGIKFKHCSRSPFGPKGKLPWITLNGEDVADSQLILEHLNEKFDMDFNAHLNTEQKAVARSMRIMMEDHLYWGIGYWRWVADKDFDFSKAQRVPLIFTLYLKLGFMSRKFMAAFKAQGIGRHSHDEVLDMMKKDVEALSIYLGKKKYIMGEDPCELDCTLFGFIAAIMWGGHPNNPMEVAIKDEYPNLYEYAKRVKERYYPNWDQRLLK